MDKSVMIVSVSAVEDRTELQKEENKPSHSQDHGPHEYLSGSITDDLNSLLEQHKRFGLLLGNGFSFGKRHRQNEHESSEDRYNAHDNGKNGERYKYVLSERSKRSVHFYGNMLGKGLAFGKRHDYDRYINSEENDPYDVDEPEIEKRLYGGGILGRGYVFGKRHFPKNRLFGNILGGGFATKRAHGFEESNEIEEHANTESMDSIEEGLDNEYLQRNVDVDESNADDFKKKRYFHSSPGTRFIFGKRSGHEFNKRYGFLGRFRFSGKRFHNNLHNNIGGVLGNGFALGKRSHEDENPFDSEQSVSMEDESDDASFEDRYIGRGYMVNKRGLKRYGYVLGSGWKFGKRSGERGYLPEDDLEAKYFIDDDGNIFQLKDEEEGGQSGYQGDDDDDSHQFVALLSDPEDNHMLNEEHKRRIGYVLGKGMSFGKRAVSHKQYGHVLGHGFSFGK
ncbi:uncharacterized protein LOC127838737 isoform X2 [Dreissena polymorpha]|uniref:uncharacterized protein LOC127838737 isoform X2 n=1 Tax=Dreissena polymorpha TaxID=45954 RepID=UPI002264CD3B|nr:uncharacterized protein LOC127838737 isoform X2 [Dreissena polymorpha]